MLGPTIGSGEERGWWGIERDREVWKGEGGGGGGGGGGRLGICLGPEMECISGRWDRLHIYLGMQR